MNYNKFIIALLLICTGLQIMQSSDYIPLGDKLHVPLSETQSENWDSEKEYQKIRETFDSPFAELSEKDQKRVLGRARKAAKDEYKGIELSDRRQMELKVIKELATQPGTIAEKFYDTMQEKLLQYLGYTPLEQRLSDSPPTTQSEDWDSEKEYQKKFRETFASPFAELSLEDQETVLGSARKAAEEEYKGIKLSDKQQIELKIIKELATQPGTIAETFYNTKQEELLKYQPNPPEDTEEPDNSEDME